MSKVKTQTNTKLHYSYGDRECSMSLVQHQPYVDVSLLSQELLYDKHMMEK